jgi:hypothetical protein
LNMPDGSLLSNPLASSPTCVNRTLDFRWTPSQAEAGRHTVCYDAVDDSRRQSSQQCLTLVVSAAPQPAVPQFTSPATDNEAVEFYMRQKKTLTITAESGNAYDVMAIEIADVSILGKYGMTMSDTRNVQGRLRATDTASSAIVSADFGWWPQISHGALEMPVCFNLRKYEDPGRSGSTTVLVQQRCISMSVPRCRYLAGADDDIKKIADIFKVDWLTLWGLNSNLPTLATPPGKQIMVGRLYQVMEGDSILSIATQFQTTVSSIRGLNYDMSDGRAANFLEPNSAICIFPELCP